MYTVSTRNEKQAQTQETEVKTHQKKHPPGHVALVIHQNQTGFDDFVRSTVHKLEKQLKTLLNMQLTMIFSLQCFLIYVIIIYQNRFHQVLNDLRYGELRGGSASGRAHELR